MQRSSTSRNNKHPKSQNKKSTQIQRLFKSSKTYWKLGHEHKFIIKVVARRENGSIVSITESDYKNLNKNDIKDMYLLIINHKVDDHAETGLLWSLSVFIKSIEKYKVYSIVKQGDRGQSFGQYMALYTRTTRKKRE
ncbi:hypothetical protein Tco_1441455 [Tanacetum coccineum]